MNDQPKTPHGEAKKGQGKGPRTRLRKLALQLQAALNTAEALDKASSDELTVARCKLAQTRVVTLNRMIARQEKYRQGELEVELELANAEIAELEAENEQLKQTAQSKPATQPMTDIDLVLQKYEQERAGKNLDEAAKMPVVSLPITTADALSVTKSSEAEIAGKERERVAALEAREVEEKLQQELKRERDALEYAERMAAADKENAALDEKLAALGPAYYHPRTTGGLL
jgi:hypothetical protein